jgi:DNA-nicking Smr family endonuclease
MSRVPKPELAGPDRLAWADATRTTTPLKARPTAQPLPRIRPFVGQPEPDPAPRARSNRRPALGATLDATWDRKIRTGQVSPELVIDLHGHSQKAAFDKLARGLARAVSRRARLVLVITGKGDPDPEVWPAPDPRRGLLRQAFPLWLESADIAPFVSSVRQAHPRHGGAGAWYVIPTRIREG